MAKGREVSYKYKHALLLVYFPIMVWEFSLLEIRNATVDIWIECWVDAYIPYVNQFVIPYILWFPFVGVVLTFMGLKDKTQFYRMLSSLYIGMTVCNLIFLILPHGQPLREVLMGNEINFFDRLVYSVYAGDTPTNSAPSIHVIFSLATTVAICKSHVFKNHKLIKLSAHVLNVLIILSTMLIKQHSIIDAVLGGILYAIIYVVVYQIDWTGRRRSADSVFMKSRCSYLKESKKA